MPFSNAKVSPRLRLAFYPALYTLCSLLIFAGIYRVGKTFPIYWNRDLAVDFVEWVGGCVAVALSARFMAAERARLLCVAALVAYLVIGVGVIQSAGAALLLASCYFCGRLALKSAFGEDAAVDGVIRPLLVGLACELAVFGVLIHFPVNLRRVYLALLAAPLVLSIGVLRSERFWQSLAIGARARAQALRRLPFWPFVLACTVIGFAARFAFFPAIDFDNNSEHLRLGTELAYQHRFTFNVLQQVWNVEPFGLDLIRGIISFTADAEARGAVALALFALILRQLWRITEQFSLADKDRLLLLALFASTPMTGWLLNAVTAELFLAFLATAGVRLILEGKRSTYRADVVAVLAVAALCAATKLPGAVLGAWLVLAGALTVFLRAKGFRGVFDPAKQWPILVFLIPFAMTAFDSYVTAWRITANPLFPLFNGHFRSIYFPPSDFADQRWIKSFNLKNYVNVFFKTSEHGENSNFVAGFQYLFLTPLGFIALYRRASKAVTLAIGAPLLGFGLLMFMQTQYMRYMFPILPLATIVIAALLIPAKTQPDVPSARLFMALCIGLNVFFYPGISWIYSVSPQNAFTDEGKASLVQTLAPVKSIVDGLNKEGNRSPVLFPENTPFGAGLMAEPVYVNWYAPKRQAEFAAIHSDADVGAFLHNQNIKHVIWDTSETTNPGEPRTFLQAYLDHNAVPVAHVGSDIRYDLSGSAPVYHPILDLKQLAADHSGDLDLAPKAASQLENSDGLAVTDQPLLVAHTATNWAAIMRYHAVFRCADASGQFVAQVNWDQGAPYYRLVQCDTKFVDFEETFPVPAGASRADLYATVHGTTGGVVSDIRLDSN